MNRNMNDTIGFFIPFVTGVLTVMVGFTMGYISGRRDSKKEPTPYIPIRIPPARVTYKKKEPPKPTPPPTEIGPVNRPTAEELEKEEKPLIKEEEEEMERSLGEVFGAPEDVEAMFAHKRKFGINTIFKKGQYAI